jgi:hypothetical protein
MLDIRSEIHLTEVAPPCGMGGRGRISTSIFYGARVGRSFAVEESPVLDTRSAISGLAGEAYDIAVGFLAVHGVRVAKRAVTISAYRRP